MKEFLTIILTLVIGASIGYYVADNIHGKLMREYEEKISNLEKQTAVLKDQLKNLQEENDGIEEEVKDEQVNKTPTEASTYWDNAYQRSKQVR